MIKMNFIKIQVLENSKKILKELEEEINMFFKTYSSNENDLKLLERCSDLENFYSDIISNEKPKKVVLGVWKNLID